MEYLAGTCRNDGCVSIQPIMPDTVPAVNHVYSQIVLMYTA
jgi:hypothetical protein